MDFIIDAHQHMCMRTTPAVIVILLAWFVTDSSGVVVLPLNGYCRQGRFFPISLEGEDAARSITLEAEGCFATLISPGKSNRVTVPMLVRGPPGTIQSIGSHMPAPLALHFPRDNERLIGVTFDDAAPCAALFPGQKLIPIHLDPTDPLPGPAVAWEALDALVLPAQSFARLDDSRRSVLLAAGVILVSVGSDAPDDRWPWKHQNYTWVLSYVPAGPTAQLVNQDVYLPTYAWAPGRSSGVRRQVVAAGALILLITLALLLRPNRWTFNAALVFLVLASGAIVLWHRSLGSIALAGGDIKVSGLTLAQSDGWLYARAREQTSHRVPWSGSTHPVFPSELELQKTDLALTVSGQGTLGFDYTALPAHTLAFVHREVYPDPPPPTRLPMRSPMAELAKAAYLSAGVHLTGEVPAGPGRWATVVIEANSKSSR